MPKPVAPNAEPPNCPRCADRGVELAMDPARRDQDRQWWKCTICGANKFTMTNLATVPPKRESEDPELGVRCPGCWCSDCRVTETRKTTDRRLRRRRECRFCGRKFTTYEIILDDADTTGSA